MDLIEIFRTFFATIVIFAVVAVIFLAFVLAHPHSKKAKAAIENYLYGCMVEASVWFAITVVAIVLTRTQNTRLAYVFEQVVGTNVLSVTIISLSLVIVPLTFSVHNANRPYDYRAIAIGIFLLIVFILGLIYWFTAV